MSLWYCHKCKAIYGTNWYDHKCVFGDISTLDVSRVEANNMPPAKYVITTTKESSKK